MMAYLPLLQRKRSTCRQRSLQKGNQLGVWPTGAGTGLRQMGHSIGRITTNPRGAGHTFAARQSLAFDDLPPESLALGLESLFDSDFVSDFESGPFCDLESASAAFLYESLR